MPYATDMKNGCLSDRLFIAMETATPDVLVRPTQVAISIGKIPSQYSDTADAYKYLAKAQRQRERREDFLKH